MSAAKRSQPDPGEFEGMVRYAAAVAVDSDPAEVRKIANRSSSELAEDGRPKLDVGPASDLPEELRELLGTALLDDLYLRGTELVRVVRRGEAGYRASKDEHDDLGPAQIHMIDGEALGMLLRQRYWTFKWIKIPHSDEYEERHTDPPAQPCKRAIIEAAHGDCPGLRRLRGVIHTPVVRADGSILDRPGYDETTGLLYLPDGLIMPPIPKHPSKAQTTAAKKLLRYLVQDFDFVTDSDRANYLGLLMTPLLRLLTPPPWPLGVQNAHQPGSGKTLLAALSGVLYSMVSHSEPGDEDEFRKVVTTILRDTTAPVVLFDNVKNKLSSAQLSKLLTLPQWSDRLLGGNKEAHLPNDRVWLATGNNVRIGGDNARRVVWSTIDPGMPHPELRSAEEFTEPDLLGYAREHRGELLAAMLTLIRAWVVAGSPGKLKRSDNFASWARAVSGILEFAGIEGEFWSEKTNRAQVGTDDEEACEFLSTIYEVTDDGRKPFTVARLMEEMRKVDPRLDGLVPESSLGARLQAALPASVRGRSWNGRLDLGASQSLGWWFRNHVGRYAGEYVVRETRLDKHAGVKFWQVVKHTSTAEE